MNLTKRLIIATCLMLMAFSGAALGQHGNALAAGGNSDAAHMCQQGGYLNLRGSDGTTFTNTGQCVSYAARGGTIVGVSACVADGTNGCLTFDNATLPWYHGSGTTIASITLTGTISFVEACASGFCDTSSSANNLATGAGTYVEKDSTGAIVSQGTFRVADTAGSIEGLRYLWYLDGSGNAASSCAAATGYRAVEVGMTLTDSLGATQSGAAKGITGPYAGALPIGQFYILNNTNVYYGQTSGIAITC